MPTLVKMPEVSANMEEAVISSWLVSEGEVVAEGQAIAEIETDKAVIELSSDASGKLGKILVEEGKAAGVGAPVAVLLSEGESSELIDSFIASYQIGSDNNTVVNELKVISDNSQAEEINQSERIFASPLAKRLAKQYGLALSSIKGTGPNGRIVKVDVESEREKQASPEQQGLIVRSEDSPPLSERVRKVPHTNMRRTIAKRLTESKTTIPHFYLRADCWVDELLVLRGTINQLAKRKISVNDLLIKAVAAALKDSPDMNVGWTDSDMLHYDYIDIAVAVATDSGLLTPIVTNADQRSLSDISECMADLAIRAREGRLAPSEYKGGSFTISNLGMYGTREFSAIINPPQSAILAVGAIEKRPVVDGDVLRIGSVLSVTLSVDHRAIDGAVAAAWLARFKEIVQSPLSILV